MMVVNASLILALSAASVCASDSPGTPGPSRYTLSDIYNYLNSGTPASLSGHTLEPPAGTAPGDTGFKTLNEIYGDIKTKFEQCAASAARVESGTTFFCTQSGSWGVQTGTLMIPPTPTPWLNESVCTAVTGWHWYNGACWSQAIAGSVSWNKGVGDDTSTTGSYLCNSAGSFQSRMAAAAAGRWSEICTSINGRSITPADDGASGKPYISAMAIADCVDGMRDIGPAISGSSWQSRSNTLKAWATTSGHSALPAVDYNGSNNEYAAACSSAGGSFYTNTSTLSPDTNFCWAAACGAFDGDNWSTYGRILGYSDCSHEDHGYTSYSGWATSFRVVVRP